LKEFYSERDAHVEKFEQLKASAEEREDEESAVPLSMDAFREDWQESQFWVSPSLRHISSPRYLYGPLGLGLLAGAVQVVW
jgi:EEF1A lysine methyltransferase 1